MAPDNSGVLRRVGGDERMFVQFTRRSRKNSYKSELEGRPIHEPIDYVKIMQPGERDAVERPVMDSDKQRWPQIWEAFQRGVEQTPEGTPVTFLFPNQPHITDLLLDLRIQTVEQLANLTEQGIERLGMDGRKYVSRAQAALDESVAVREVTRLEHELNDQKDRVAYLEQREEGLMKRIDALERVMQDRERPMEWPPPRPRAESSAPTPPPPERPQLVP